MCMPYVLPCQISWISTWICTEEEEGFMYTQPNFQRYTELGKRSSVSDRYDVALEAKYISTWLVICFIRLKLFEIESHTSESIPIGPTV